MSGRWALSAAASDSDGRAERQRFPLLPSARVGLYWLWMALREIGEDVRREGMGLAEQKRQPEDKLTEHEASASDNLPTFALEQSCFVRLSRCAAVGLGRKSEETAALRGRDQERGGARCEQGRPRRRGKRRS